MALSPGPLELQTALLRGERTFDLELNFSPDGALLACTGPCSMPVLVWETATGQQVHALAEGDDAAVAFSPGSDLLAVAGDEAVSVWELRSGKQVAHFGLEEGPGCDGYKRLRFDPEGRHLVLLNISSRRYDPDPSQDHLRVWDLVQRWQAFLYRWDPGEDDVFDFLVTDACVRAFSVYRPDGYPGPRYFSGIDLASGARAFAAREDGVRWPRLTPDKRWALFCADWRAQQYEVWNIAEGRRSGALELPGGPSSWPVFSPDGRHVVQTSSADGSMLVWDAWTGRPVSRIELASYYSPDLVKEYPPTCAAASPQLLAVVVNRPEPRVDLTLFFDPLTGVALGRAQGHPMDSSGHHLFSPCGRWFASVLSGNANDLGDSPDPVGTVYLTDLAPILPRAHQLEPAR